MSQLTQLLPSPIQSKIVYEAVMVENPVYDPVGRRYIARVYGVCRGTVMPLILSTAIAVRRIEETVITDAEIDEVLAARPELGTDRIAGALARAFERLYALVNEQPPTPW